MCELCKRRRNFLLHANEEEGKKESIKEISAVSTGILSWKKYLGQKKILAKYAKTQRY